MSANEYKKFFTEEDCKDALQRYAKYNEISLESYEVDSLSNSIEGMLGEHFIITANYTIKNVSKSDKFFMKIISPDNKVTFDMAMSINAYEKEVFFYNDFLKQCASLGINVKFAPEFYFAKPHLTVLENLNLEDFKTIQKRTMFDREHTMAALRCLARFHASSIIFQDIKSKQNNAQYSLVHDYRKILAENYLTKGSSVAVWYEETLLGILTVIDELPENHTTHAEFKQKLRETFDMLFENVQPNLDRVNCILHGDLWANNFMFKYENGEITSMKLIDFQLLRYGHPSMDVMQLILTDVRKHVRDKYINEFLDVYYKTLQDILQIYNVSLNDLMTKESFIEKCQEARIPNGLHALGDHSITFMFNDLDAQIIQNDDDMQALLIGDRQKDIVKAFSTNKEFRELITEDLLDLRSAIFS